ncbi:tRNA pseudouridine(38-40) synthase TruA [Flavobacteriaceae bacterium]|nr:tRNA pseudouridine(38-40) synthase TruA [Flavobacteriaceae bacterium]
MRYLLELSFNGANYHGWQIQPNSVSVQETIERCLSTILNEKINIVGAGRTDSGVHASYFCAHFDYDQIIKDKSNFIYKSNSFLPKDISINKIYVVKSDFHARFDAVSRTYQYRLNTLKNPFLSNNSYYLRKDINFYKMNLAALKLYNYKDFKSFSKSNTDVYTFDCNITDAKWSFREDHWIFEISANRFLRNMVRAIVGTLIEIGEGKHEVSHLDTVIKSKDREVAGYSVPAQGLCLTNIVYPKNSLFDE